ncbi:MAG TPA: bifunctional riboflavin kinase/FMN adenylyltransferase [Candidatus Eisenbacteria bacterium]|nr:bifunctional riboflavin kinase/FMN adenylyltransferase [Candidatus Eisenbacteria bacterium]
MTATGARPIALAIGVFDGLHRGHREVMRALTERARSIRGAAWVATFDPHPDTVVRGVPDRPWITPPEERAAILHGWGVDRVETVRFDPEIQALSPEGFLDRVLGPGAPLQVIVAGPDFRMGKGRAGDRAYLESLGAKRGFAFLEVPFLAGEGGKLSSTRLREVIAAGRMEEAEAMMGRRYALEGTVGSGAGRGAGLGFPTANLEVQPQKLLPAPGIYLSECAVGGKPCPSVTYIGSAGTFGPGPVRVEVHLMDYAGSLRGSRLKALLISQIRADKVFSSKEALVSAMEEDLARARALWASAGSSISSRGS